MDASTTTSRSFALLTLLLAAHGATGCAETYIPRGPNIAVVAAPAGPFGEDAVKIYKRGMPVGDLENAVHGSPRAEEEARDASSQRTASVVLGVLGGIGAGVGGAMIGIDAGQSAGTNQFPTSLGWAGVGVVAGSLVFAITSGALRSNSQAHYFNAINIYNDEVASRPYVPYMAPMPGYPMQPPQGWTPPQAAPQPMPQAPPNGFQPAPAPAPMPAQPAYPLPPGAMPAPGTQPIPLTH